MYNFLNKKRILSLLVLVLCAVLLIGCGKNASRKLWDSYVKAVNSQNLEEVAKTFYVDQLNGSENVNYRTFIENNADYFANTTSLKTLSYEEDINCDFSSGETTQVYYGAKIKVQANGSNEYDLYIYTYSDSTGTFFCSEFKVEGDLKGNQPNQYWKDKVYYTNDDYKYKVVEKVNSSNDVTREATYIEKVENTKHVVIPAEIDGAAVKQIGEYAFYKYNKILCFTIPKSKMKTIEISEGIETINKFAFYQCKKLGELTIPESVKVIDKMAFASCTGLKKLEFQARTEFANTAYIESVPEKPSDNIIIIEGAHNLQTGEIVDLVAVDKNGKKPVVKWTSSSPNVATVDSNGRVVALSTGTTDIKATLANDPTNSSKVTIIVTDTTVSLSIANDAFNRCSGLEEIYFHATNPNSIAIANGSNFTFNNTCKIYVPKGSGDMYKAHTLFSPYAEQIVEMEQSEDEMYLEDAKSLYLETVGSNATLNGVYTYINPIKADNILYTFNYTKDGKEDNLIIDLYTGSFLKNNRTKYVVTVNNPLLIGLLANGSAKFGDVIFEQAYTSDGIKEKLAVYYQKAFEYAQPYFTNSELTFENATVEFEELFYQVENKDFTIITAITNIVNKATGEKVYNNVIVIFNEAGTYKVFGEENALSEKENILNALNKLLLNGNKIA